MATQQAIKELSNDVAKLYAIGLNTLQVSQKLNVSYSQVLCARSHIAQSVQKEAGSLWVTFLLQYQQTYQELQVLKQSVNVKNNVNAQIGIARTLIDLTDKQVMFAMKLGLVHEEPTRVDISLEERADSWERFFGFKGIKQEHLASKN